MNILIATLGRPTSFKNLLSNSLENRPIVHGETVCTIFYDELEEISSQVLSHPKVYIVG